MARLGKHETLKPDGRSQKDDPGARAGAGALSGVACRLQGVTIGRCTMNATTWDWFQLLGGPGTSSRDRDWSFVHALPLALQPRRFHG